MPVEARECKRVINLVNYYYHFLNIGNFILIIVIILNIIVVNNYNSVQGGSINTPLDKMHSSTTVG